MRWSPESELADDISEELYSDLRTSKAFTPELVDKLVVKAFDNRFSHNSVTPVDNGEPPNIVHAGGRQIPGCGILAKDNPPKNQGEPELITDMGSDQAAAAQFARFLTENTNHQVHVHGEYPGPGMTS